MDGKPGVETRFERAVFASRWLMAPIYLGLVLALVLLLVVFVRELVHYVGQVLTMDGDDVILAVLTLIDLALAGNLLLIVLLAGYENFVSKFDLAEGSDRPVWIGTVDFSGMKVKLIASIVAISAVHLLKWFMEIQDYESGDVFNDQPQLRWLVIIHLTFVASGVLLALMDWIAARVDKH